MSDDNTQTGDTLADRIGRAIPGLCIIGLMVMSMIGNPVFSGRPATDAKLHAVYLYAGLVGLLLYLVILRQHQRMNRLEQRLSQLTDFGDRR